MRGVDMGNMVGLHIFIGFWLGAVFGSFINAAAMRTVADKKWWGSERSVCDSCGRVLSSPDLIPIISYIVLQGRCRSCKNPIPRRHIAAELTAGAAAALFVWKFGLTVPMLFAALMLPFLLFHALTDIESGYIYDSWALVMTASGLALRILGGLPAVVDGAMGAGLGFGFIFAIVIISRGGMGFGDAMLMLGIGAFLGWRCTILALYMGFLCGGFIVIPLLIMKKVSRKDHVPLGPFLAFGAFLTILFGAAALRYFGFGVPWPWM